MPETRFAVRLKKIHDKTGLTHYMVGKQSGVAINTVVKYTASDVVEVERLDKSLAILCNFYGVDFHDVVEVITTPESDPDPESETPLIAAFAQ